ncbi:MAG: rRNA maturation RNase YbeY [Candidatus Meridianibacter frigidus]|nr:MAG: rRNA maturation RNase YbeY [Candidatus Eremiobacteraeota bacterium]
MIYYRNTVRGSGLVAHEVKATAKTLLDALGERNSTLSLSLVDDREIQELNRAHRGFDKATDVLSFPLWSPGETRSQQHPERLLGDVVISVETARRQAAAYDAPLKDEVSRLLIHGLLHVMGHDHEEAEERERMQTEERRLAGAIGMPWPYDD